MRKIGNIYWMGLMALAILVLAIPVWAVEGEGVQKNFQTDLFTGSVSTAVPIQTFAGPGGLSPSLSISYSSLNANQLGAQPNLISSGWDLVGGNDKIIKTSQGRYMMILNGIGYDLVLADDGWHTNPESFAKVTRESNGWKAIDRSGKAFYFGQSDDTTLHEAVPQEGSRKFSTGMEPVSWSLDFVEDVNGNGLKYEYQKFKADDGHEYSIILKKITCCYRGSELSGSPQEVLFVTSKKDINEIFKKNGIWIDRKLDAVEIRIDGKPLRKYALGYDTKKNPQTGDNFDNPGFETGNKNGWNTAAGFRHSIGVMRYGGSYSLNLHLESNEGQVQAWQKVTVPKTVSYLKYRVAINGLYPEFNGLGVYLYDAQSGENSPLQIVETTRSSSQLEERNIDLSKWAGKEVTIYFRAENLVGDKGVGDVYIDDVSLGEEATGNTYTLKSITQHGTDGKDFNGTLPSITFEHKENLLISLENGRGGKTGFKYEKFFSQTEKRGVYEENERNRITEISTDNGLGDVQTTRYAYTKSNGERTDLFELSDGEFRGHGEVSVTSASGVQMRYSFEQSDDKKGMLNGTELVGNDGKLYGRTSNKIESRTTNITIPEKDQPLNPGFDGNILGWTASTSGSGYVDASNEFAYSGSYSAKFMAGGVGIVGGKASLRQDRAITPNAKHLSFMGRAVKYPAGSKFRILLDDGSGTYEIFSGLTGDEWNEYVSEDISRWAGKSVGIIFEASQDAGKEEVIVYIDDVKFLHRTPLISFPYVSETRDYSFEGRDQAKMTLTIFERDDFGNPTDTIEYGEYDGEKDRDVGNDKRETVTDYINDLDRNILGVPKHSIIYGFNIDDEYLPQRESWMYYDNEPYGKLAKGQPTQTKIAVNEKEKISVQMGYDSYGNAAWTIDGNKNLNPRTGHTTDVEFDSAYHAYPTKSCNVLDYCSQVVYDELMRAIGSIDINGQVTNMSLDFFGRAVKVARPGDSLEDPTEKTVYQDKADFAAGIFPFVETILKDGTEDGLRSYGFEDGLGNVIQVKKEGAGNDEWLVTDSYWCGDGCADQNSRGKLDRTSVPYSMNTGSPESVERKDRKDVGVWIVQGYDPIGRSNRTAKPDGTFTGIVYGIWQKDIFDAMNHKASEYSDGLGMIVRNENYLGDSEESYKLYATRTMKYNTGSGEVVKITDSQGNELVTSFDMAGRKTNFSDPDLGSWRFEYDANGNTVNQTDAKGQAIKFVFDALDRMTLKDYPTQNDTAFFYDDPNASYGKGYLYRTSGHSGGTGAIHTEKYFQRDMRGRVVNTTFVINGTSWSIESGYNSLDWVVNMTYPDGEVVTTRRNKAGMIDSPDGKIPAVQSSRYDEYPYLKDVTFWQGKPERYIYGNRRESYREYNDRSDRKDPYSGRSFTYRLYALRVDGDVLDLKYGLDDNGNVRTVLDGLNPDYSVKFKQDDLSRLVGAESLAFGELSFSYNNIGNILSKDGLEYAYPDSGAGAVRPHAPIKFGDENFDYDGNGNMVVNGNLTLLYNFDNNVERVKGDCGTKYLFGYADGERVVKREKGKITYYIGGIYEEEWLNGNRSIAIKYYSAGDITAVRRVNLTSGTDDLSFIHADHLGSSTRVTNSDGELTFSVGYKPYGEESYEVGEKNIKRLFTGKEKDEKVGLYYYGARYYDPSLGRFITPDPVEGLNRYEYVRNNPVNLIDPSGYAAVAPSGGYPDWVYEPMALGIRPIDIMWGTMPGAAEVNFGGSQAVAKPIAKRIAALAPEQLKKIRSQWQRYDDFKSKQNAIDLVKVASGPRNEMGVKTNFNSWTTHAGVATHSKGDWNRGASSVMIGQRALETPGKLDSALVHEYYHDLQWRGGKPIEYNLLETQAYDIELQNYLLYLDNGPAEVKAAGETYMHAVPYAKMADKEAGQTLGYVQKFNAFFDEYIKPRIK